MEAVVKIELDGESGLLAVFTWNDKA